MNKYLFLGSLITASCYAHAESGTEVQDKNVLLVIVDDLNTTLGCYGHSLVKTPNIDRLAGAGILFNHAFCNYAVSNPSRSSMLTGLRPETTNILDNKKPVQTILDNRVTLPALFRRNGYHTMSLGKIFHGQGDHNDPAAWDEIYTFGTTALGKTGESRNITGGILPWCEWRAAEGRDEDQPDGLIASKAVEFIFQEKDKPFFLAVGFHKPHDPFVAPKKYFEMYPLDRCDPPVLPESWSPPYKHSLPQETKVFSLFSEMDKREFLRSYYACITFMDAQFGKILDALEKTNQLNNTLIIFMGDHGYHLGEHNWWNKVTIYEKGTKIPLIIAGNSAGKKGTVSDAIVELVDIYPTLAGLFRLKDVPGYLEGEDFTQVIQDPALPFRNEARSIITRGSIAGRTVRTSSWRYTEWDGGTKGAELYDEINDPLEYRNLAGDPAFSVKMDEMKRLLNQNKHSGTSDYMTCKGLLMAGYQGWFIQKDGKMYSDPSQVRIDMWPDMKEYEITYPTGLKYADGSTATFYSATDKPTIDLHFKWMKQYGIDGVFMQRFFNYTRRGNWQHKVYSDMLANALDAASKYKRAIAVEYDLSGLRATGEDCSILIEDWKFLVDSLRVTSRGENTYLYHNGKPLVAIWGLGFPDRPYNIREIGFEKFLDFLKNDPVYGGCSILLGVPTYWRELGRDCVKDSYLHDLIRKCDIVLPWMVGRTRLETYDSYRENIALDLEWCRQNKVDYIPVVWPGFSWHNLKKTAVSNATPRHGGLFFWKQLYHSINYGCEMIFVAMFDEVNEGTAIYKVTNDPPVDKECVFVGLEGKPSDHYLWLAGQAARMLKKEIPLSLSMPERKGGN